MQFSAPGLRGEAHPCSSFTQEQVWQGLPRTDGEFSAPRGCVMHSVCKWSRELGSRTAEPYLLKAGQKESAGGGRRRSGGPCL